MAEKTVSINVLIDTIDKVKDFVRATSQFDADMDIISGRYVIDAKSILGLFSLDLSEPVQLRIEGDSKDMDAILEAMAPYEAK